MSIEELLKKLNIDYVGTKNELGSYVIDLDSYEDFGKVFSKLEKSELVKEMPDTSVINTHTTDVRYISEEYDLKDSQFIISLVGDLDGDIYKIVIDEIN